MRDNRIVSVTPTSFSAIPNRVKSGPHTGLNTLKDEEGLARRLMADLSPKLQGRARIGDSTPYNILSYAGRERANAKKVGLAAAELSSAQRDLLWKMIELYSVEHFPASFPPRSGRACNPATGRPCISPGTPAIRRRRRSAIA